ncbi:MAG: rhodanese-like domain-containing protein [Pseudomonadales bacterium]|jgi:hydroxyacylglutathione hydrolase
MFVETIKTPGLAQLSYVIGSDGQAAVIDPRRDVEIYVEVARAKDCRITRIFETHRNEDLISGAPVLAELTGAGVHHGPNAAADVRYADVVRENDEFPIGKAKLRVLETPGHTDDSLSFVLSDTEFGDDPVAVFTGDALFVGDVGRTDFYPDRAREVAGSLFDSLQKILDLGDQTVLYPAHGAGSVCGSGMADREVSTIGYERRNNPRLKITDRDRFIDAKLAEHHDYPPYFEQMETLNLSGAPAMRRLLTPQPLAASDMKSALAESVPVDVRSTSAFLGAHLPGSLSLPVNMISAFAGWILDYDDQLVLIADDADDAEEAARHLGRIGFDRVVGYLEPSLPAWAAAGESFGTLPVVGADQVKERKERSLADWVLLDVRGEEEVAAAQIDGAQHVYVGALPAEAARLPRDKQYTVMCASGARATVAASILLRRGFHNVDLFLGSMGAWKSQGYDVDH